MVDTRRENKAVDNHSKELLNAVQSNSLVIKKLKELKESLTEVTCIQLQDMMYIWVKSDYPCSL